MSWEKSPMWNGKKKWSKIKRVHTRMKKYY